MALMCCRSEMSELLFECYCVPRLAYGIDAMFSYCYNVNPSSEYDALILSCGYQATHVLPVLDGHLCAAASQRINVGGAAVDGFMQRVLQLKYPQHFNAVTLNRAEVSALLVVATLKPAFHPYAHNVRNAMQGKLLA